MLTSLRQHYLSRFPGVFSAPPVRSTPCQNKPTLALGRVQAEKALTARTCGNDALDRKVRPWLPDQTSSA